MTLEPVTAGDDEWVFIETIDTTTRSTQEAKDEFWARHPELHNLDSKAIRMDVASGRGPASSALRFWVRKDAVGSGDES